MKERSSRELESVKGDLESMNIAYKKQCDLVTQLEEHVEQLQTISTPYR